ncbi:uncharacterized protein TNCV_4256531 [Trichonephila clavipes]|nr:uncharacterized protein TNCV_4256531 [Trichonephila clavipes]
MSESSDYMELSPSKFDQVSACAKLRDTVTGISALHLSIHGMDGRSPSPGNSFMDMYISGKQAMIRRKAEMVKVEGYLVRGITQCFNCNNFYHTAANCFMKPRCLKCGKDHATRNCHIKERQENPFCINCQDFGHSACYTKCPKFPNPKKALPFPTRLKEKIFQANGLKREFPSLTLLAEKSPIRSPPKPKT